MGMMGTRSWQVCVETGGGLHPREEPFSGGGAKSHLMVVVVVVVGYPAGYPGMNQVGSVRNWGLIPSRGQQHAGRRLG